MGDLISRQAVLNLKQTFTDNAGYETEYVDVEDIKELTAISSVENKGEWIPVSERLPEDDTEVIYCDKNGVRGNCHYWKGFNRYPRDKGEYQFPNDIVAWMPLPEPYKEGGE